LFLAKANNSTKKGISKNAQKENKAEKEDYPISLDESEPEENDQQGWAEGQEKVAEKVPEKTPKKAKRPKVPQSTPTNPAQITPKKRPFRIEGNFF